MNPEDAAPAAQVETHRIVAAPVVKPWGAQHHRRASSGGSDGSLLGGSIDSSVDFGETKVASLRLSKQNKGWFSGLFSRSNLHSDDVDSLLEVPNIH